MKRVHLTFAPYELQFRQPFLTARERLNVRRGYLVRVQDDDGFEGFGEAAPIAGFGMETLEETRAALKRWVEQPADPAQPAAKSAFSRSTGSLAGYAGVPAARHGVESALADLEARRAGIPLYRWLLRTIGASDSEGRAAPAIAVNGTLGALDPQQAERDAAALAADGIGTIKVKVGDSALDRARVRAVHRAAPRARLRVDANGAWDAPTALAWLRAHQDLPLEYAEQPTPTGDLGAMQQVAAESPVPIAADESVLSESDAHRVLAAQAAQVLVLKPMALGGPLAALRIAQSALRAGAQVVVTTSLEGAFGRAMALHVAAAIQVLIASPLLACGLATGPLLREDLIPTPPVPLAGYLTPSTESGLGMGADLSSLGGVG